MKITGITYIHRRGHKLRNMIVFILVFILIAAVTVAAISAYIGWKLTHPERLGIPVFSANIVPEYDSISFNDIKDEVTLKGWYFDVKGSKKTVILAHGYRKNRLQFGERTIDLIKSLLNEGYNVLTFDFRNSGESEGKVTSVGLYEKDDLLGAVQYIKSKGSEQIVLMGFSMGAASSILAASENKDIDAVIADSSFSDLTRYLSENLNVWSDLPKVPFNETTLIAMKIMTGVDTSKVCPEKVIHKISPRPVLLIHSKDDKTIPVKNSRLLSKLSDGSVELWETSGVGHVGSYEGYTEEYTKRVISFLHNIKTENIEQHK
ncbi:MAG: alpha/beta hydrolase [Bacillota bacterium]